MYGEAILNKRNGEQRVKNFTTNMAIQNISKSNDEPTKEQEIVNGDLLKKIKLIEKAFR